MTRAKILLVEDDSLLRGTLVAILEQEGFRVTEAGDVNQALQHVASDVFDVLVTDLHMPGAADGLTIISAMRHANPKAVTLLLSAFPEMDVAAKTILSQADQVLVKPLGIKILADVIRERLAREIPYVQPIESVATIIERSVEETLNEWYKRVEGDEQLMASPLSREQRTGHIPKILMDLVNRLRSNRPLGGREITSTAAHDHGRLRREQGYSAAMMVDESRMLQVSIFEMLDRNMDRIDFSLLLKSVMTIADEVDSQLSQAMESYRRQSEAETPCMPALSEAGNH